MKKKAFIIAAIMTVCFVAPILMGRGKNLETDSTSVQAEIVENEVHNVTEENEELVDACEENNVDEYEEYNRLIDQKIEEMNVEMDQINSITDKKEWFLAYKSIFEKYNEFIDPPETIYDYFSEEQLGKLFRIVEAEATEGEFTHKANVCSVIFNRMYSEEFDDLLDEILVETQFMPLSDGRWKTVEVTEDTILACEYVFMIGSTVEDAVFFDSTNGTSWASRKKEPVTNDGLHSFYR